MSSILVIRLTDVESACQQILSRYVNTGTIDITADMITSLSLSFIHDVTLNIQGTTLPLLSLLIHLTLQTDKSVSLTSEAKKRTKRQV